MRGTSLRSRLFQAIGVVVIICVALTIGLGLVLTRRAVEKATLQDLAHQADLVGQAVQASVSRTVPPEVQTILRGQHESYSTRTEILPAAAQQSLARHLPVQGTVTVNGVPFYFAARYSTPRDLILFRRQSTATSLLSPYVWGLLIAAGAGGLLAALAAFLVARRISRPIDRIAAAARTLAGGTHPEPVPSKARPRSRRSRLRSTSSSTSYGEPRKRSGTSSSRSATS